ncbi:MAG: tRNA (N(6)-L-threonylcarbamoyladenosine(37)-C(2))-methylthiotransferase [Candidatus Bathyarchaeota archaeon]|nr:tRNA (N(6)-L-threonylcarbamoyladenosine(37)-C(2))-methylthiotransferase [Candidatus Bathyarchaeota archaeon]
MQKSLIEDSKSIERIYLENYGCSANTHDLEIILGYLSNYGYIIENMPEKSDIIIINTCGVKKPTEDRIINRLKTLGKLNIPIIITGCLPKINLSAIKSSIPNYAAILDPYSVDNIIQALDYIKKGHYGAKFFSEKTPIKVSLPEERINNLIKIVPISEGCLGDCAYCCTRFARGRLSSFPIENITEEVNRAISEGVTEIWITGQDTGSYGKDIGLKLTDLLTDLIEIKGDFRIRLGMMNPNYAKEMIEELVSIYKNNKIYKFLHVPIQSGSDRVLELMNRQYKVSEVEKLIKRFRKSFSDITIATDVIVGFPTESDVDFNRSIEFVNKARPDIVNISKFATRPKTIASKLPQIPNNVIKERSKRLSNLCSKISSHVNSEYLDSIQIVYINKELKKDHFEGRLQNYKKVLINQKVNLLGKKVHAKIENVTDRYLEARVISEIND